MKVQYKAMQLMILAILFFVVSHPKMYDLVDRIVPVKDGPVPSDMGVALHSLVFLVMLVVAQPIKAKLLPS